MSTDEEIQGLARLNAQLEKQLEDVRIVLRRVCDERDRVVAKLSVLRDALDSMIATARQAHQKADEVPR